MLEFEKSISLPIFVRFLLQEYLPFTVTRRILITKIDGLLNFSFVFASSHFALNCTLFVFCFYYLKPKITQSLSNC